MRFPMPMRVVLAAAVAVFAGCGGSAGGLSQDLTATHAEYQIIDLQSATVEAAASVAGLAVDARWRDRYLVVRRLPTRETPLGQAAGTWAVQPGDVPGAASLPPCYLGVFELTRAQWRRIGGDEPWTAVQPADLIGIGGDDLPACGISHDRAVSVLAALRARGLDLRLPSDAAWESAARHGGGIFPWGDARDGTTASAAAVVAETAGGLLGPRAVGGRAAAPSGCYDLVGNVAEWTQEGFLRGGSWNDPLSLARPAHARDLATDVPLATAGLRVVFVPAGR